MAQQKYGNVSLQGLALLWVASAWLVGIFVGSFIVRQSFALVIGAVVMLLWYDSRSRWISLLILFAILGAWRYSSVSPVGYPLAVSAYIGAKVVKRGEVSDEPKFESTSRLLPVSVHSISLDNGNTWRDTHGQVTVQIRDTGTDDPYAANYGSDVKIYGKVISPFASSLPGIAASMFFPRVVVMGTGGNPIIGALYQLRTMLANIRRGGWRRWLATALVVASIVIYTLLSGGGPAAVRAGIMGVLLVIAPRIGRRYNIYTALAGAALLISMQDPFVLCDVGFQLSFLGTLGIVLLTPLFQRLLHPLQRLPLSHYLIELFAVTLAAQVATLPILVLNFQVISFVAPLTNMLTVPLLGILLVLGTLICIVGCICMPRKILFFHL